MNKKITISDIKKHIKKCKRRLVRFNFLGFVENKELTSEVNNLFIFISPSGYIGYDWVNGNNHLKDLINNI